RLINSARERKAVDLSVVLSEDLPISWPGRGVGNHRQPFVRIRFGLNPNTKLPFEMHVLDAQTGTHLVPPAYALPRVGFDNASYAPEVRTWLAEYETKYGPRGTSDVTAEKVPISQSCGPARIIDFHERLATTDRSNWPASPEITPDDIRKDEARRG